MSEKPLEGAKAPIYEKPQGKAIPELGTCPKAIGEALENGATLEDIAASFADGKAEAIAAILPHRWTEQYEALRKATEDYIEKTGDNVKVFLCNMGPIPQHKARADFSASFMEVAHFDVLRNNGFATVDEAVDAAVASGADVAIICSTDDTYPELVPPIAKGIKAKAPNMKVYLAGAPAPEFKASYDEAGVDEYIHVRANCLAILTNIQKGKGII
jgi:methylmalonyl-CoA mutase